MKSINGWDNDGGTMKGPGYPAGYQDPVGTKATKKDMG